MATSLQPGFGAAKGRPAAYTPAAWLRLGDILVERGDISRAQLSAALERKRDTGRRVGEELVAAGDLRAERLAAALRLQRRLTILAFAAALIPMTRDSNTDQKRAPTALAAITPDADVAGPRIATDLARLRAK